MAENADWTASERQQPLTVWTLSTVNTVGFVLALLIPSYASGGLSDVLPTLGTALGLGVFAFLWLVVWATTRWLLDRVDPTTDSLSRLVLWAGAFGSLDGIIFVLGIVIALVVPTALVTSLDLLSVALIAAIGVPIAAAVGAVVGITALSLDLVLLRASDGVTPRDGSRQQ